MEDFEALLKESFEIDTPEEGTVVKGKVIAIASGIRSTGSVFWGAPGSSARSS